MATVQGPWDVGTWGTALWDDLPITGLAATTSLSSLNAVNVKIALTGLTATTSAGTLLEGETDALSGLTATTSPGSVAINSLTLTLSGLTTTTSPGTVIVDNQILIIDVDHDGERKKKNWEKETKASKRRRAQVIEAFERVIEGKPEIAAEIAQPFIKPLRDKYDLPRVSMTRLAADKEASDRILREYLAIDDDDVTALL
jgi:hypothetical protein